jgi:hypothetical protein
MYIQWSPPDALKQYVAAHPIEDNKTFQETEEPKDPWMAEARRVFAGLNDSDKLDLPGFGEVSLAAARDGIKAIYDQALSQSWNDYAARGGTPDVPATQKEIPPVLDTDLR